MHSPDFSRRDFLRAGAVGAGSVAIGSTVDASPAGVRARRCILLMLVGGPSQLETFDPKPNAPAEIRGPFGAISTTIPGVHLGEHLPLLAGLADRFALIRSVHHDASEVHETGLQLLQTGRLASPYAEHPHIGSMMAQRGMGRFVMLPTKIGSLGLNVSRGQSAGSLGIASEPTIDSAFTQHLSSAQRDRYGKTPFGDACARAVQHSEAGAGCVVVNMFESLQDRVTWDCHADRRAFPSTLSDYRRTICPMFDRACATLLEDLSERGLLDETLVVAMGEMGRAPRLNANGGRDHWTRCWSILLAGGGVPGGAVIGSSDAHAAEPTQRPVACGEVAATIGEMLGIPGTGATAVRELISSRR